VKSLVVPHSKAAFRGVSPAGKGFPMAYMNACQFCLFLVPFISCIPGMTLPSKSRGPNALSAKSLAATTVFARAQRMLDLADGRLIIWSYHCQQETE
jgi:hypothetical protein